MEIFAPGKFSLSLSVPKITRGENNHVYNLIYLYITEEYSSSPWDFSLHNDHAGFPFHFYPNMF